jgi:hypothetical protein
MGAEGRDMNVPMEVNSTRRGPAGDGGQLPFLPVEVREGLADYRRAGHADAVYLCWARYDDGDIHVAFMPRRRRAAVVVRDAMRWVEAASAEEAALTACVS